MSKSSQIHEEYELEKNKLEKNAKDTKAKIDTKVRDTTEYAKEKGQEAKYKASEIGQDISNKASNVAENVAQKGREAKDKASEIGQNISNKASEVSEDVSRKAHEMKPSSYGQGISDVGSGQNRGLYDTEADKISGGAHYTSNVRETDPYSKEVTPQTEGILQSAKDTLTSAYNVIATKVQETTEVAKEKLEHLIHGDPAVTSSDYPKVGEYSTKPPGSSTVTPVSEDKETLNKNKL